MTENVTIHEFDRHVVADRSAPHTTLPSAPLAPKRARIALLGASGYSGQEFARLVVGHPGLTLACLVSREKSAGGALLTGLDGRRTATPPIVTPEELPAHLDDFDTLVACLPHGAFRAYLKEHSDLELGPERILDLSADRRDGADGYVYGLPELFRDEIRTAARIANPGCYPTAAALALFPALAAGLVADPVMISALSGVSGAGRTASLGTSFVELDGGASLYKVGTVHTHVPEMERTFHRAAGAAQRLRVAFAPNLVPMARGILLTATAPLTKAVSPAALRALYEERYEHESFVRLLPDGAWPATRDVKGSNRCDIAVTTIHDGTTLLVTAAIDNLVKGASGQAIQNLNLMLGWPETTGLTADGRPW